MKKIKMLRDNGLNPLSLVEQNSSHVSA
jgi:hypothetical protein